MAFGKLHGVLKSAPLNLPGKNAANLTMAAGSLAAGGAFLTTGDPAAGVVKISCLLWYLLRGDSYCRVSLTLKVVTRLVLGMKC